MGKDYTKEIFRAIGRIEGDIKGIHTQMKLQNNRLDKHSERINGVETNVDIAKGKAIGAGFVAGIISSIIMLGIAIVTFFRRSQ